MVRITAATHEESGPSAGDCHGISAFFAWKPGIGQNPVVTEMNLDVIMPD